ESPNQSGYNASKHAAVALTRCAALEHGRDGINVNAICPGFVETDMLSELDAHARILGVDAEQVRAGLIGRVPLGRLMTPADIAPLAVYLGSAESDGMTGQTITIAGGMRMG
ncbi:MAG: SDR family oxidoreductase, partial [Pseudomonadota bacterium]